MFQKEEKRKKRIGEENKKKIVKILKIKNGEENKKNMCKRNGRYNERRLCKVGWLPNQIYPILARAPGSSFYLNQVEGPVSTFDLFSGEFLVEKSEENMTGWETWRVREISREICV